MIKLKMKLMNKVIQIIKDKGKAVIINQIMTIIIMPVKNQKDLFKNV